jgi:hypothetical protein
MIIGSHSQRERAREKARGGGRGGGLQGGGGALILLPAARIGTYLSKGGRKDPKSESGRGGIDSLGLVCSCNNRLCALPRPLPLVVEYRYV